MRKWMLMAAGLILAGCADSAPSAAQESAGSETVVATVNGTPITERELRAGIGSTLARLEAEAYDVKRRHLDSLIAARLIAAEAERRGVTPETLEAEEITAKVPPVTDEELSQFIEANRARIRGDADALRSQIRDFLAERKLEERRQAFVDGLRAGAEVSVSLTPPEAFRAEIDIEGAPVRGDVNAPVTIVEFSDFHCPYCRAVQPTLLQLLDRYEGQVRLVYKHLPLDALHPQARQASRASWCAAEQGRFWEFHDAVYASGSSDASDEAMNAIATKVGLDLSAFGTCLTSREAAAAVDRDAAQGEALGLTGTPGFFVNGRELTGAQPLEAFAGIIDEELGRKP